SLEGLRAKPFGIAFTTLRGHAAAVTGVAYLPGGETLISSGGDGVRTWDVETGKQRAHYPLGEITCLTVAPDGKSFGFGTETGKPATHNLSDGSEILAIGSPRDHVGRVSAVAFSPDSKLFASASWDGCINVYDLPKLTWAKRIACGQERLHALTFAS